MKKIIILLALVSCAQIPQKKGEEMVSVNAALNHAQASYLKGCVDAYHVLKIPVAFPTCRERSLDHRREIDFIMDQN